MHSIFGRYLNVDLSSGRIGDYVIPSDWSRRHLGGRGIAARILLEELSGKEGPLSSENILVFATGPFQGTGLLGAGRHVVMGISPKTKSVADSYVGGYFGHELGRSGYDGILLRGEAAEPVVLTVIDGAAGLQPAGKLWGKGTAEAEARLLQQYPGARVASIGIAGEKLVQMACIIHDRSRAAGRPGLGAVMGAKRLKAIVVRGNQEKRLCAPERFRKERADYVKSVHNEWMQRFGETGTSGGIPQLNEMGILPTRNFQEGVFDAAEAISGQTMVDTILVGRETCVGCPIRCKRQVKTTFAGREVVPEYGGPEYETVAAFGSLCENSDLHAIALANQLCNEYGIDTISAGVAIAFVMEAGEKGLIENGLAWGDAEGIVGLIDRIAQREGIGDCIAAGLEPFAKELGADFVMAIKGVEIPMHEPRGKQGLGISYAVSPRGANHMEGIHDTMLERDTPTPELGVNQAYDRFTLADKAEVACLYENLRSFTNSLVLCCFTTSTVGEDYNFPAIRSLLDAATGLALTSEEMLRIGERNYALMRLHAVRAGYTAEQDDLPERFFESLPRGASANHPIDRETLRAAVEAYYQERGYDRFGPTEATLRKLGMEDCIGVIAR